MARGDILIATESFFTTLTDGRQVDVVKGVTRVRDGHELARTHPQYFRPIDVHYELEDTTAEPGRKRGER